MGYLKSYRKSLGAKSFSSYNQARVRQRVKEIQASRDPNRKLGTRIVTKKVPETLLQRQQREAQKIASAGYTIKRIGKNVYGLSTKQKLQRASENLPQGALITYGLRRTQPKTTQINRNKTSNATTAKAKILGYLPYALREQNGEIKKSSQGYSLLTKTGNKTLLTSQNAKGDNKQVYEYSTTKQSLMEPARNNAKKTKDIVAIGSKRVRDELRLAEAYLNKNRIRNQAKTKNSFASKLVRSSTRVQPGLKKKNVPKPSYNELTKTYDVVVPSNAVEGVLTAISPYLLKGAGKIAVKSYKRVSPFLKVAATKTKGGATRLKIKSSSALFKLKRTRKLPKIQPIKKDVSKAQLKNLVKQDTFSLTDLRKLNNVRANTIEGALRDMKKEAYEKRLEQLATKTKLLRPGEKLTPAARAKLQRFATRRQFDKIQKVSRKQLGLKHRASRKATKRTFVTGKGQQFTVNVTPKEAAKIKTKILKTDKASPPILYDAKRLAQFNKALKKNQKGIAKLEEQRLKRLYKASLRQARTKTSAQKAKIAKFNKLINKPASRVSAPRSSSRGGQQVRSGSQQLLLLEPKTKVPKPKGKAKIKIKKKLGLRGRQSTLPPKSVRARFKKSFIPSKSDKTLPVRKNIQKTDNRTLQAILRKVNAKEKLTPKQKQKYETIVKQQQKALSGVLSKSDQKKLSKKNLYQSALLGAGLITPKTRISKLPKGSLGGYEEAKRGLPGSSKPRNYGVSPSLYVVISSALFGRQKIKRIKKRVFSGFELRG